MPPSNLILKAFKWLDRFFFRLNENRWTKGRVLLSDKSELDQILEPVAWRETTKTSLGSIRYLIRLLIGMETPVVIFGLLLIALDGSHEPIAYLIMVLWVVVTLIVAAKATSLVAGERARETFDVLLTTPMSSYEIIAQKFRGVTRLMLFTGVPILTAVLLKVSIVQIGLPNFNYGNQRVSWLLYLLCSITTLSIYLPLTAWLSLLIGIRIRSQSKAIFVVLATLVTWCVLPVVCAILFLMNNGLSPDTKYSFMFLASPAFMIALNEFFGWSEFFEAPWVAWLCHTMVYGVILIVIRFVCLRDLDKHFGRPSEMG